MDIKILIEKKSAEVERLQEENKRLMELAEEQVEILKETGDENYLTSLELILTSVVENDELATKLCKEMAYALKQAHDSICDKINDHVNAVLKA